MAKVNFRHDKIENAIRRRLGFKPLKKREDDKRTHLDAWDLVEDAWRIFYSIVFILAVIRSLAATSRFLWRIYDNWPPDWWPPWPPGGFF
jgi:hypothetical protein